MAGKWTIIGPELPKELIETTDLQGVAEAALQDDGDVAGYRFAQGRLQELAGVTLEFSGCVFDRCVFEPLSLKRMSFVDCVFEKLSLIHI